MKLFSDEHRRHPFPMFAQLRRHSPVIRDPQTKVWMVFDYENVKKIVTDHEGFSSAVAPPTGQSLDWLVFSDPPNHGKLRNLFMRALTPRSIMALEPRIRQISQDLLSRNQARGEMELVTAFSGQLPGLVISGIIGMPAGDTPTFLQWNDMLLGLSAEMQHNPLNARDSSRLAGIQQRMSQYLLSLIRERRRAPQDDLVSRLNAAEADGERLNDTEIMAFLTLLFSAATETSTNLIGSSVLSLLEFPEQLALLRAKPELAPSMVEEVLRYRSPVQALIRRANRDVRIHGQLIPAGDFVFASVGSANHDEKVFADSERFDITRDPNPHVAFGYGIHYCMGAQLARLEARLAIPELFARLPDLRRASNEPWQPHKGRYVFGPARLPLRFTPVRG